MEPADSHICSTNAGNLRSDAGKWRSFVTLAYGVWFQPPRLALQVPAHRPCEPTPLQVPPPPLRDRRPDPLARLAPEETVTRTAPLFDTRPLTVAPPAP